MKNRKGFTIVELVIVIAVIAILAAVLIPTFSGVIQKANESSALQEATSTMKSVLAMSSNGTLTNETLFVIGDKAGVNFAFEYEDSRINASDKKIKNNAFSNGTARQAGITYDVENKKYNSIIINDKIADGTNSDGLVIVKKIINTTLNAVDQSTLNIVAVDSADTSAPANASYKIVNADGSNTWWVFTNSDFAEDIVVFTYSK